MAVGPGHHQIGVPFLGMLRNSFSRKALDDLELDMAPRALVFTYMTPDSPKAAIGLQGGVVAGTDEENGGRTSRHLQSGSRQIGT
jgi:hypothetical protein